MNAKQQYVIGLMSGTSLDGVDAAVLRTDGETVSEFGPAIERTYSAEERKILAEATQDALAWDFNGPPPNSFARAEAVIHAAHIEAVKSLIQKWGRRPALIGFHGQTVLHRPPASGQNGQTLQLGDGNVLARALGIPTAYDFRTADMRAGGQGAPLAPIYHAALLEMNDLPPESCVLNIGGVANFTMYINGKLVATDCGPGNGPLDSWVQQCGLGDYDQNGALSLAGTPDFNRLAGWMRRDFFHARPPKSADRWDFDVLPSMHGMTPQDGAATLASFCAMGVADTLKHYGARPEMVIACGGGRKNAAICAALTEQNIGKIVTAEQVGWHGDDLEAQAFAFLAKRHLRGLPLSYPGTTGVKAPTSGGKIAT